MTFCYVLHQKHSEFWHIQNSASSDICSHIQPYSALLRHILRHYKDMIRLIEAYAAPCVTLPIHNLVIFQALPYLERSIFKTLWKFEQVYSEPCHSQNSLFKHYSAIFRTLCNAFICRNLACLESCNIPNPFITAFQNRTLS